jgi:hypothetical protein
MEHVIDWSEIQVLLREALPEALEPVRAAYWNTNAQGRAALLADLITYVTRGF